MTHPSSALLKILHLIDRGLVSSALQEADSLRALDEVEGCKALMHVFAEMTDFLGFSNLMTDFDFSQVPEGLEYFAVRSLIFTGQHERAASQLLTLYEKSELPRHKIAVAGLFEELGVQTRAKEILDQLDPGLQSHFAVKIIRAKFLINSKEYDKACSILENLKSSLPDGLGPYSIQMLKSEIGFLLSRAYDKLGDYDSAWRAASDAHKAKPELFDVDSLEDSANRVINFFTKKRMSVLQVASDTSVEPLLVMGNPRSGTTLLDTILGMHEDVVSGGELALGLQLQNKLNPLVDSYLQFPECLSELRTEDANVLSRYYSDTVRQLSRGRRFVTNKALNICMQLGFLRCVSPNMRTISLRRHPLDNCVSCFMNLISMPGHGYVQNQKDLARVWITRQKLQDHWGEVFEDEPLLEVHYESMVRNQEHETRRILNFLSLNFSESCLNFHTSSAVAATVSREQVQQPIYNSSAGRWTRYEKHLTELIDHLGPWL